MNWFLLFYFFFGLLVVLLSANQGKMGNILEVFTMSIMAGGFVWVYTVHLWKESIVSKKRLSEKTKGGAKE